MKRREFITLIGLLGGAAAAWPRIVQAQQADRVRKVGVMFSMMPNDPEAQARSAALREALRETGWIEGRNLQLEYRWRRALGDEARRAAELAALAPDVILTSSTAALRSLVREAETIPIVFVQVPDPVSAGFVQSLARPGGNVTGFTSYERTITSKWLSLLKESAPAVTRATALLTSSWAITFRDMEAAGSLLGTQLAVEAVKAPADIERAIDAAAREPNGGLIVLPGPETAANRAQIIALTAKYRLPTVYPYRYFAASGGVLSYGIDTVYLVRQAASYIDRILKGAKPADLPVQAPTKFELIINLQSAKALGIEIPPTLLARADEVIE
jgi:putative tryptophan/tyrosine transport system substrate-binding protein